MRYELEDWSRLGEEVVEVNRMDLGDVALLDIFVNVSGLYWH